MSDSDHWNADRAGLAERTLQVKLNILGDIQIAKYISIGHIQNINDLLAQKSISNKAFTQAVLQKQLVPPRIPLDQFKQLPDGELIELGRIFVDNQEELLRYFKDTGDFYKDFRFAVTRSTEEFNKELKEIITTGIHSWQQPLLDSFKSLAKTIADAVNQWQRWVDSNKQIFSRLASLWAAAQEKYNIAEARATDILTRYKWFMTPSFPISFIFEVEKLSCQPGRQDKAVNQLFIGYFIENNCENLEAMVNSWKHVPHLQKRMSVLANCVQIIKLCNKSKINCVSSVLPALIAQVDGTISDYLTSKNIRWDIDYGIDKLYGTGKVRARGRKTQFKKNRSKPLTVPLDELADSVILDVLFQAAQKGKALKTPFNFNRHKIMHGETVTYGRKDYLIRAFLALDFLACLN